MTQSFNQYALVNFYVNTIVSLKSSLFNQNDNVLSLCFTKIHFFYFDYFVRWRWEQMLKYCIVQHNFFLSSRLIPSFVLPQDVIVSTSYVTAEWFILECTEFQDTCECLHQLQYRMKFISIMPFSLSFYRRTFPLISNDFFMADEIFLIIEQDI